MNMPFDLITRVTDPEHHDAARVRQQLDHRQLPETLNDHEAGASRYQPDDDLLLAINSALVVGAPLLLTGEPGTGKTQVAYFLSWYLGVPLFRYQVRSTSTAQDLKYDFDAVAYLRSAQHPARGRRSRREDFLTRKALWQAYSHPGSSVLLIDEIDKAPRDFPNDLLLELDQHRFRHPFQDREVVSNGQPPVVVITSNAERRLPDAFLRRCVLHCIEMDEDLVQRAVDARVGEFPRLDPDTRKKAIQRFWELYRVEGLSKRPSTAELLTWLAVLSARKQTEDLDLDVSLVELPSLGVLIKDAADLKKL